MKWGNFGFAWPTNTNRSQSTDESPFVVRMLNDIALQVIKESGYDVKVYDIFWLSWSRPHDTEVKVDNATPGHMVHPGLQILKVSVRKLITIIADYFGCFSGHNNNK